MVNKAFISRKFMQKTNKGLVSITSPVPPGLELDLEECHILMPRMTLLCKNYDQINKQNSYLLLAFLRSGSVLELDMHESKHFLPGQFVHSDAA
jgi:hypothetical protein